MFGCSLKGGRSGPTTSLDLLNRKVEMGSLTASLAFPLKQKPSSLPQLQSSLFVDTRRLPKNNQSIVTVARLFGPAIFDASKLKVMLVGVDEKKHPGKIPRTYTLTHCDTTSNLTLSISQTINNSQVQNSTRNSSCAPRCCTKTYKLQGWYNRLQRDEVIAEWKKVKGKMSLHVHCHISGGHFLLDLCASLRYFIFYKELPVVLKAFVHGDEKLFNKYPELQEALVWVYFHSNISKYNKVDCWGPLKDAATGTSSMGVAHQDRRESSHMVMPQPCSEDCTCCFPQVGLDHRVTGS